MRQAVQNLMFVRAQSVGGEEMREGSQSPQQSLRVQAPGPAAGWREREVGIRWSSQLEVD
jgi:hypothetical protein